MLTHLKSLGSLTKVLGNIYHLLKSDSQFIGVYPNAVSKPEIAKKYNFRTDFDPTKHFSGAQYTTRVENSDGSVFEIKEIHLPQAEFRRCAEIAGFIDVQFANPIVSEEGTRAKPEEFWKEFRQIPIYQFFVCKKF